MIVLFFSLIFLLMIMMVCLVGPLTRAEQEFYRRYEELHGPLPGISAMLGERPLEVWKWPVNLVRAIRFIVHLLSSVQEDDNEVEQLRKRVAQLTATEVAIFLLMAAGIIGVGMSFVLAKGHPPS